MDEVVVDQAKQTYNIRRSRGWDICGFQKVFDETVQLAQKMEMVPPSRDAMGTVELFKIHEELLRLFHGDPVSSLTWFEPGTELAIRTLLNRLVDSDVKVRVQYGTTSRSDPRRGRPVLGDFRTGYVARSAGVLKRLLVVNSPQAAEGILMRTHEIVRIIDVSGRRDIYLADGYNANDIEAHFDQRAYVHARCKVVVDGEATHRFQSSAHAERWVSHMSGSGLVSMTT